MSSPHLAPILAPLVLAALLTAPALEAETVVRFGVDPEQIDPEQRVTEHKLASQKVSLDFEEATLAQVVEFLRKISGINIVVDPKVYQERSEEELQISLDVDDLPLGNAVKLILDLLDLRRSFRHGVMMISTPEAEAAEMFFKIYDVRDIMLELQDFPGPNITLKEEDEGVPNIDLDWGDEPRNPFADPDTLTDLISTSVRPESWDLDRASIRLSNGLLIVTNTAEAHAELRTFLAELRSMR